MQSSLSFSSVGLARAADPLQSTGKNTLKIDLKIIARNICKKPAQSHLMGPKLLPWASQGDHLEFHGGAQASKTPQNQHKINVFTMSAKLPLVTFGTLFLPPGSSKWAPK